jgi:hypothetical protein
MSPIRAADPPDEDRDWSDYQFDPSNDDPEL